MSDSKKITQSSQKCPNLADPIALTRQLGQLVDKRIDVLRRIHETGSISEAARSARVSYKAAWQAIETLGNLAGSPLVEKAVGGSHGGGTILTPTGLMVLELTQRLNLAKERVLAEYAQELTPDVLPVGTSTLRTSMRNQFPVTIKRISRGPAMVRITLQIDDKNALKASLTQESSQLLGLSEGDRVLALCKATAVEIAVRITTSDIRNAHNIVTGTVIRMTRAAKGGEVTLRLSGGASLVGFCHAGHGLKLGEEAQALIPAQAIVVALYH